MKRFQQDKIAVHFIAHVHLDGLFWIEPFISVNIVFMPKKGTRREKGPSTFSRTLLDLMTEKKLGVREAARIAGVGPSTLVSWRAGALPEDYGAVRKLAQHFGVTLGYLLTGEDDSRPTNAIPAVSEVFADGGALFDGYAKITIQRLIPKTKEKK